MLESLLKEGVRYLLVPQVGFTLYVFLLYFLLSKMLENVFSSDLIGQILAYTIILTLYLYFLGVSLPLMFMGPVAFYLIIKSIYMIYIALRSIFSKD
jgi:hypothetical protein